jgi:hypothetical protein
MGKDDVNVGDTVSVKHSQESLSCGRKDYTGVVIYKCRDDCIVLPNDDMHSKAYEFIITSSHIDRWGLSGSLQGRKATQPYYEKREQAWIDSVIFRGNAVVGATMDVRQSSDMFEDRLNAAKQYAKTTADLLDISGYEDHQ